MDQPRFKATYKGAVIGWYDTADEALAAIEAEEREYPPMPWCERCQCYHHVTAEHITITGETIDMTPVGCQTPEGCKRVAEAQDEWDTATHMLANVLKEMLDTCIYGEGFSGDELQKLKVLIGWRDRKQEAFLRAVAGAPGKPK